IDIFNVSVKKIAMLVIQLVYNNNYFVFILFDGETGFDLLFGHTDADHVKIELDCYWVADKGYDPLELMQQYPDQVVSLHMKDMTAGDEPVSTEVNQGILPMLAYMKQGIQQGVKGFIVEQE